VWQPTQRRFIPRCQLSSSVECYPKRHGVHRLQPELDHVALGPAQLTHGHEAPVAADDAARPCLDDQWLGLAEARETGLYGRQVALVAGTGVRGVEVQCVERDARDRQFLLSMFQVEPPARCAVALRADLGLVLGIGSGLGRAFVVARGAQCNVRVGA